MCNNCIHESVCGTCKTTGGHVKRCDHFREQYREPLHPRNCCDCIMEYDKRLAVYGKLLARNGAFMQSIVALEELSEAQKEICKLLRDKGDIEHLAEEIADATIMLEQIQQMYGIEEKVSNYMDEKVQRILDRLEETT